LFGDEEGVSSGWWRDVNGEWAVSTPRRALQHTEFIKSLETCTLREQGHMGLRSALVRDIAGTRMNSRWPQPQDGLLSVLEAKVSLKLAFC
jgi:hypothetical protein